MDILSTVITIIIILLFLAMMYRALKEPFDLVFSWIKRVWYGFTNKEGDNLIETIRYD